MPTALTSLTTAEWDKLKAPFGKTPALKALFGGSASVGPAITAFRTQYTAWTKEVSAKAETINTAMKYFSAVNKLAEAFAKFEKIKDLGKPDAKTMKDSVAFWKKEAAEMAKNQAGYIKANEAKLKTGGAKDMGNVLDQTGIGGKQK